MSIYRKEVVIVSLFLFTAGILSTIGDFRYIYREDYLIYFIPRAIIVFLSLFFLSLAYFNKIPNRQPEILFILLIAYSAHGQFFRPGYFMAFFETIVPYGIFFHNLNKKTIYSLYLIGLIVFANAVMLSNAQYRTEDIANFKVDVLFGSVLFILAGITVRYSITQERQGKEKLLRRFADIGRQSATIFHDLKGLFSSPKIYSNLIEDISKKYSDENLKELAVTLNQDITYLSDLCRDINQMSVGKLNKSEINSVSEIVELTKRLYRPMLRRIDVKIIGDHIVEHELDSFFGAIVNAILNSAQSIDSSKTNPAVIIIECKNNSILIKDNGGGFSNDALVNLNAGHLFSSKINGSGLGTYIIRDYVESISGRIRFYNENISNQKYAVVELHLPNIINMKKSS